ncbi:MAG: stage 0 sporulation family protein [Desulfomonilaceae bacterium]
MSDEKSRKDAAYLPRAWGSGPRGKAPKEPVTQPARGVNAAENSRREEQAAAQSEDELTLEQAPAELSDDSDDDLCGGCDKFEDGLADPTIEKEPSFALKTDPHFITSQKADTQAGPIVSEAPAEEHFPLIKMKVVGVRFGYACKIYHFDAGDMDLTAGDWVIVKTEKGIGLGHVALAPFERFMDASQLEGLRNVLRKAGKVDFDQKERCTERESEAYTYCLERIEALGLDMKLVAVECFFDGSKYVFYFTADGRVDFRELVKQLVTRFPVRIEMRQIGVRHEAKMTGGLACCGQELCCSRFLTDFRPVSVKMAKNQNLSLNPTKISGVCGRLMCCLGYEHDIYEEFRRQLPKVGKAVRTQKGEGVVVKHNPLAETIFVRVDEENIVEVGKDELIQEPGGSGQKRCSAGNKAGELQVRDCDEPPRNRA